MRFMNVVTKLKQRVRGIFDGHRAKGGAIVVSRKVAGAIQDMTKVTPKESMEEVPLADRFADAVLTDATKAVLSTRRRSVHRTVYSAQTVATWVHAAVAAHKNPEFIARFLEDHPSVSRASKRSGSGL